MTIITIIITRLYNVLINIVLMMYKHEYWAIRIVFKRQNSDKCEGELQNVKQLNFVNFLFGMMDHCYFFHFISNKPKRSKLFL